MLGLEKGQPNAYAIFGRIIVLSILFFWIIVADDSNSALH